MSHHGHCIFLRQLAQNHQRTHSAQMAAKDRDRGAPSSKNSSFKRMGSQTHPGAPPVYATYNKTSGGSFLHARPRWRAANAILGGCQTAIM